MKAGSRRQRAQQCQPQDPIGHLIHQLLDGVDLADAWPRRSVGDRLLRGDALQLDDEGELEPPAWPPAPPVGGDPSPPSPPSAAQQRLQQLIRQRAGRSTAVVIHDSIEALAEAAQRVICTPEWFEGGGAAGRVIAADAGEAQLAEKMLRTDYDDQRGEDLLEAARWTAETLFGVMPQPGLRPVLLATEEPVKTREVYLLPGGRGLRPETLLPWLNEAVVLHLIREAG